MLKEKLKEYGIKKEDLLKVEREIREMIQIEEAICYLKLWSINPKPYTNEQLLDLYNAIEEEKDHDLYNAGEYVLDKFLEKYPES